MNRSELLEHFRSASLAKKHWTHRAHLIVALAYLEEDEAREALPKLRKAIQRLNLFHGVYTNLDNGYHETRTRVWLAVLQEARSQLSEEEIIERFSTIDVCQDYYSKETLNSWEARIGWLAPDVKNLSIDPGQWGRTPPLISLESEIGK